MAKVTNGIGIGRARAGLLVLVATTICVLGAPPAKAWASTVTVQRGQTLTSIAAQAHTTVSALVALNHLRDANQIQAGQELQLPSGPTSASATPGTASVVLARGQTLTAIAARYNTTVAALAAANGIADPNRVLAGTRLVLPASASAAPGMALASYTVASGSLPTKLAAHPDRLALRPDFYSSASRYGVPVSLLEAMCWWESGWQSNIVSPTGAVGVCQIEPYTAKFINQYLVSGNLDAAVPAQNIAMGAAYLAALLRATGGDASQALAGYYQGLSSVRKSGMLPATVIYVHGIEAYAAIFASG